MMTTFQNIIVLGVIIPLDNKDFALIHNLCYLSYDGNQDLGAKAVQIFQ